MPSRDDLNRAANVNNPFEDAPPRISVYTAREVATLQSRLDKQLGPEYISTRPGPGGSRVHYLAADKVINLANEVFGFNGWSTEIKQVQIDFVDESQSTGKISLGLSIIVRVTLKDGTFHEDIGYGQIDNCKGKGAAFMKAKKEAVTDGLKRALRNFGNVVGNCLYDKDFLQKVTKIKPPAAKWDPEKLHRHPQCRETSPSKTMTEVATEPLRGSTTESVQSEKSKGTNAEFEDDFEGTLFDGVELESGDPDEIVLDVTTYISELRPDEAQQRRPQGSDPRQHMARVQSIPSLRPLGAAPTVQQQQQQQQQRPPQHMPVPQSMKPPGPAAGMPQHQHDLIQAQRLQQQAQAGPPHLSAVPPPLQSNAAPEPGGPPNPIERVGFVTGRAAAIVQDPEAPLPANVAAFNPHAESPSIRRTNGVDHHKSVPINRSTLAPSAPQTNTNSNPNTNGGPTPQSHDQRLSTRGNFVNPHADMGRRIGMPGAAQSPLGNRGGFRQPQMQKRDVDGVPRPALADVSNVQLGDRSPGAGGGANAGVDMAKRQKLEA